MGPRSSRCDEITINPFELSITYVMKAEKRRLELLDAIDELS